MNNKYIKYIDYIVNDIELPYIKSLEPYGLKQDEMDLVLSKVFNSDVRLKPGMTVFNEQGNIIYFENSNGFWAKKEYNNQGNLIYHENSNGYWVKREYDEEGNKTYHENSNGYWEKIECDEQGNIL